MRMLLSTLAAMTLLTAPVRAAVETGSAAPEFTLTDTQGTSHNLSDFKGKFVVLEWVNHGCPFVKKFYRVGEMQKLQADYTGKGVVWLSICSSAPGKQGNMSAEEWNAYNTEHEVAASAVLIDEDGTVGKQYGARTTPHMYVINPEGTLIYQGAIDSVRSTESDDIPDAENYVRSALDAAMAGEAVATPQTEPYGCSVKY
ncbi:MAG: thioredoxin family protein [Verrucomicrobia bacterium]|nr:thioredoxin family protein [Verrucomicrobiota bacterium]